ncbi:MAG: SDR family oxidoreductase [Aliidiomarina sp.]|uniref:SDR family oxidoreductase n=1 Tax=Aliidiomarina sp. TaxID=1872439 RepID=UPI0025BEB9AF|nr:SDR family oxidoreductase [Aliidiomarina sp.]MCH8500782.1 SDR family oxidoreductase [Aliidiomarina sp.]
MSEQKSIFISGAAAGIGKATAEHFLAQGWLVGAYDIDQQGLQQLASAHGSNLVIGDLDVTDNDAWQRALAEFASKNNQRIDVLFNNAGVLVSGPVDSLPLASQQNVLNINVNGVLAGCYLALPYLKPGARVINMSSASALYGQPSLAVYSASKFAVRALTEALSLEWETKGIQVMDVMPLFVQTNMVTDMNAGSIGRLGVRLTPQDVAKTVWMMAHYQGNKVHWLVGTQTKLMAFASKISPDWLLRLSNKWITR